MNTTFTRRAILTSAGAFTGAYALPSFAQSTGPTIAVIGGGFAGGTAVRTLASLIPNANIQLIEKHSIYRSCPLSNLALIKELKGRAEFASDKSKPKKRRGPQTVLAKHARGSFRTFDLAAEEIDTDNKVITLKGGFPFLYDYLIIAAGVDIYFEKLPGYDEDASWVLPHGWKGADSYNLLQNHLHFMPDGGTVIITTPPAPYRCPPGPYERASLIAHYLKTHKPRSKVLLLDANQTFSKQALFEAAWERFYPGIIERRGPGDDGRIIAVNAKAKSVITDFDEISGDVVNVIPPQRAGVIARIAGVTDASGWCPVDPVTFESTLRKNIFVIGDAAQVSPMPKSAFAAAQQARICALNLARRIQGLQPIAPIMSNTCYSFLTPDRACSITGVYQAEGGKLLPVSGAGGQSPIADEELEIKEAGQAKAIIDSLLKGAFG